MNQAGLPLLLFGAGLPQLAGQAGDAKNYAERLFDFPRLDRLQEHDACRAIRDPVEEERAAIEDAALAEIYAQTHGYPYFLQEWGYNAWNVAPSSPITVRDARAATTLSIRKLDESFFRVRFDRLTPLERDYMLCLAELGPGAQKSSDVAKAMNRSASSLGPTRDSLIKKGMIYAPEHGQIAFTVPLFDEFMRREMPLPRVRANRYLLRHVCARAPVATDSVPSSSSPSTPSASPSAPAPASRRRPAFARARRVAPRPPASRRRSRASANRWPAVARDDARDAIRPAFRSRP